MGFHYKTYGILALLEAKCQKAPKTIEKALAREGFRAVFSEHRKTL